MAIDDAYTTILAYTVQGLLLLVLIINVSNKINSQSKAYRKKATKQCSLPPGPVPWPIVGNIPEMLQHKPTFRWIYQLMKEMNTQIACIRFGNVHVIPVSCPKIALEILKKQDANFASRPPSFAARTIAGGYKSAIIAPYGEQWKKMRKILTSEIVCPARHKWLQSKRDEEADNLVLYVYNQFKKSKSVDVRIAARHYCGNVIRRLMFDKRYFGQPMPDGGPGIDEVEHVDALFKSLSYLYGFCVSDYFPGLIGLDLDGHEKVIKHAVGTMNKYHDPIIDERIQQWRHGKLKEGETQKEPSDFLDILITLKDADGGPLLTPDEIKAQTRELMIAAVDNPSNAVEWALAEMLNIPEAVQKAVEELDTVVGKERLVQESDIPKLNYIKACIREAFRLHPIAPFNLPHVAMADTTVDGYRIPKGSHVLLGRVGLGRNPDVWEEPLKFKPERHLTGDDGPNEVVLTEPNLRFISFSTGRRGCIAASLGTTMAVMLFARLLQAFTWSKPQGVSKIDLAESRDELFLAKPLILNAEPRLPLHLFPAN